MNFALPLIARTVHFEHRSFGFLIGLFYIHGVHRLGIKGLSVASNLPNIELRQGIF